MNVMRSFAVAGVIAAFAAFPLRAFPIDALRAQLRDRTLTNIPSLYRTRPVGGASIVAATLQSAEHRYFVIVITGADIVRTYRLYTFDNDIEDVSLYTLYANGPIVVEYTAATAYAEASKKTRIRYLVSDTEALLIYDDIDVLSTGNALRAETQERAARARRVEALLGKAERAIKKEDYSAAREACEEALSLDFKSSNAHLLLGYCDVGEREFKNAETRFSSAIAIDYFYEEAYTALAELFALLRENEKEHAVRRKLTSLQSSR